MTATLRQLTQAAGALSQRRLYGFDAEIRLDALTSGSFLEIPAHLLRDRSVLIATDEQFATAVALIECDGLARRIVICPANVPADHLRVIATAAQIDIVLCDDAAAGNPLPGVQAFAIRKSPAAVSDVDRDAGKTVVDGPQERQSTQWILLTSGTTGAPKLVVHTLQSLVGPMTGGNLGIGAIWSTFYDIRRYGGLQIFLRAMIGGGSMVLSSVREPVVAFLARAGGHGVSHVSGTPSHWRRVLMSPRSRFTPRYVRLSGEIADQAILDRLRVAFHDAAVSHAFASTEAGVAFDITDGLAGFPANLIGRNDGIAMRVQDGSLRIKSNRTALQYLGEGPQPLCDPDGFVDTGDMVDLQQDRYLFIGRRSGIINVGGLKVHPEEVELVIAEHPRVRMCVVKARRNSITGEIVIAEIVADFEKPEPSPMDADALKEEIIASCRCRLAPHKVPVSIRFVPELDIAVSGKMRR